MATYVLLHGAYQGGWIWQPVATCLRAAGHTVYAPTLDGCGERAHLLRPGITVGTQAQEIAQLLFYEDLQDVVLVGTSAGGMVLCKAAELARERLTRLVFVDALALLPGEQVGKHVRRAAPNARQLAAGPRKDAEHGCLPTSCARAWALALTLHPRAAPKRRWRWTRPERSGPPSHPCTAVSPGASAGTADAPRGLASTGAGHYPHAECPQRLDRIVGGGSPGRAPR
jgi:pimeloyl-ACP methyl ester carboxylesterase